jgi:very-short-patch-repair endonuclease
MGSILMLLIVVVVIVGLAVLKAKSQGGAGDEVWPFYPKNLLSQPEQALYFQLIQASPEHIVLAQVQLSRLLGVKNGNNYQALSNHINRMSADFVVCNKDSSIVAVIELGDATHQREDRQAADAKKDKALASAGVRIVRWQAKSMGVSQILPPSSPLSCLSLRSSGTLRDKAAQRPLP